MCRRAWAASPAARLDRPPTSDPSTGPGLWEPKAARAATEEAAKPASVSIEDKAAAAASAAAAQMLHAGPVSPPPQPPSGGGGTDMRAVFAKLKTCTSCVGAGYGWCTIQRKCGGFANRECGAGERYVAEGHEGEAEEAEEAEAAGGMDSGEVGAEEAAADDDFSGLPRVGWKTFKREVMDCAPAATPIRLAPRPASRLARRAPTAPACLADGPLPALLGTQTRAWWRCNFSRRGAGTARLSSRRGAPRSRSSTGWRSCSWWTPPRRASSRSASR